LLILGVHDHVGNQPSQAAEFTHVFTGEKGLSYLQS
jgi:hypothetical protein